MNCYVFFFRDSFFNEAQKNLLPRHELTWMEVLKWQFSLIRDTDFGPHFVVWERGVFFVNRNYDVVVEIVDFGLLGNWCDTM